MRKGKNLFLALFIALCVLCYSGTVSAQKVIGGAQVPICEPNQIVGGGESKCYVIINTRNAQTPATAVKGYVVEVHAEENLMLATDESGKAKTNSFIDGTASTMVEPGQNGGLSSDQITCNISAHLSGDATAKKDGCAVFYSTGTTSSFSVTAMKSAFSTNIVSNNILAEDNVTGLAGSFSVKIEDLSKNEEKCGRVCIRVTEVNTGFKEDFNGTNSIDNVDGGPVGDHFWCRELHYKAVHEDSGSVVVPDGAFASYAVLIAGALIAISIITIAKKNKKVYRV